jgi:hypothetical protein
MKESSIQIQCFDYLSAIAVRNPDLFFFSIPNEGLMTVLMAFKIPKAICARIVNHFKKMGLVPGVPDFQVLYKHVCFFVEFKKPGKDQNTTQLKVHEKINNAGFTVYVCHSFEEFNEVLLSWVIK